MSWKIEAAQKHPHDYTQWADLDLASGYLRLHRWWMAIQCLFSTEGDPVEMLRFYFVYSHPEGFGYSAEEAAEIDGDKMDFLLYTFIDEGRGLAVWLSLNGLDAISWNELVVEASYALAVDLSEDTEALRKLNRPLDKAWLAVCLAGTEARIDVEQRPDGTKSFHDDRDKFIYDERMKSPATPYSEIRRAIKLRDGWRNIGSDPGARSAADRFADRHGLPPVPRQ